MKKTSSLLAFILVFVLISGCGGGGGDSSPGTTTNSTPSGSANASPSISTPSSSSANSAPIANAGLDQTVPRGVPASLDGTGSADPDGDLLSFQWTITTKPNGSAATLSAADTPLPYFTPDQDGNYIIQLIVVDSQGLASSPETVTVSTINSPPVADAGPDQSVISLGTTVLLGGQSYDPDGDAIVYSWSIKSKPANSLASLSDPASPNPTFMADVYGDYIIQLVVNDPWVSSAPDTMEVSFGNLKPVANAGNDLAVGVGTLVSLDGSGSSDPNGDPLSYRWSLAYKPAGSAATLNAPTIINPTFTPDLAGTYVVSLIVNDGTVDSDPSTTTITVFSSVNPPIQDLLNALQAINGLPTSDFKNRNMKKRLANKVNAAIRNIDNGLYQLALSELQTDILKKMDGCHQKGTPDHNDWITNCPAQNLVYPDISAAIADLKNL